MSDDELIEKAAKAAYEGAFLKHAPEEVDRWEDLVADNDPAAESWREVARHALAVFREHTAPTDDSLDEEVRQALDILHRYSFGSNEIGRAQVSNMVEIISDAVRRGAPAEVGSCWDEGPVMPGDCGRPGPLCALPSGHAGAHRTDVVMHGQAMEWIRREHNATEVPDVLHSSEQGETEVAPTDDEAWVDDDLYGVIDRAMRRSWTDTTEYEYAPSEIAAAVRTWMDEQCFRRGAPAEPAVDRRNRRCERCGHEMGNHAPRVGCVIEGCPCSQESTAEIQHTFDSDDCVTRECDCGAPAEPAVTEYMWEYGVQWDDMEYPVPMRSEADAHHAVMKFRDRVEGRVVRRKCPKDGPWEALPTERGEK